MDEIYDFIDAGIYRRSCEFILGKTRVLHKKTNNIVDECKSTRLLDSVLCLGKCMVQKKQSKSGMIKCQL